MYAIHYILTAVNSSKYTSAVFKKQKQNGEVMMTAWVHLCVLCLCKCALQTLHILIVVQSDSC